MPFPLGSRLFTFISGSCSFDQLLVASQDRRQTCRLLLTLLVNIHLCPCIHKASSATTKRHKHLSLLVPLRACFRLATFGYQAFQPCMLEPQRLHIASLRYQAVCNRFRAQILYAAALKAEGFIRGAVAQHLTDGLHALFANVAGICSDPAPTIRKSTC